MRGLLAAAVLAATMGVMVSSAPAQSIDPHRLYEQKCAGCHTPHARDFAHESLSRTGDKIVIAKNNVELKPFLAKGHGKLSAAEIDVMVAHLTAILQSGSLFQRKCIICHDRAVVLARAQLILKDDRLIGRYSKRDMGVFLAGHGRLAGDEIDAMLAILRRQLEGQEGG